MAAKAPRFRRASLNDARDLWRWRNDAATRRASLNTAPVPWPVHRAWIERRLSDPKCVLWILEIAGKAAGQLRLEENGRGSAEVSIGLAPAARGRGLGALTLRAAAGKARARGLKRLTAIVKPDNVSSALAFLRAGFRFSGFEGAGARRVYCFELELKKHG